MIGPPAEKVYPVDPVGVDTMIPSPGILLDKVAIDAHVDANKLSHVAMADDYIIQRIRHSVDCTVFVDQFRVEHHAIFNIIVSLQHIPETLF
jgi:hypothetical protein